MRSFFENIERLREAEEARLAEDKARNATLASIDVTLKAFLALLPKPDQVVGLEVDHKPN